MTTIYMHAVYMTFQKVAFRTFCRIVSDYGTNTFTKGAQGEGRKRRDPSHNAFLLSLCAYWRACGVSRCILCKAPRARLSWTSPHRATISPQRSLTTTYTTPKRLLSTCAMPMKARLDTLKVRCFRR